MAAPAHFTQLVLAAALAATVATAQPPIPAGPPFDVPSQSLGDQERADVGRAADGGFVVVWEGSDGSTSSVFGRRFAPGGEPLGDDFQISVAVGASQQRPRVAVAPEGGFLVVWEGFAPEPVEYNVYARAYGAAGAPLGPPRLVPSVYLGDQYSADVAAEPGGSFVVVWQTYAGYVDPVFGRSFDAQGEPLGEEFRLDPEFDWSDGPAVAATGPGEFVVAYHAYEAGYGYTSLLAGQKFDLSGNLQGAAFRIDPDDDQYRRDPQIAADAQGNFVVVWQESYYTTSLYARRFAADGTPAGDPVPLDGEPDYGARVALAVAPNGDAHVAWNDSEATLSARFLPATGGPVEPVAVAGEGELAWDPGVAVDASGSPVFVWSSWRVNSEMDVLARRFVAEEPFFEDGFDGGGPDRWSLVVP
ncbi:MAG: hypothetical protein F9K18_09080 [Thermoanaerobaculia bacterium]|nr:MAG: hypothetical protein F9K18_09080 [Thermoanaerobaculia bacterium]